MSEENAPIPGESGKSGESQAPAITQAELDKVAAAARREAEAKLKETQERLAALEAEKKKREEAEMTELEKLKKEREELAQTLEERESKLKSYEEKLTAHEQAIQDRVEKQLEGLTDAQKSLIELLPLEKRLDAIAEFKQAAPAAGNWGKGTPPKEEEFKDRLLKAKSFSEREKILREQLTN